MRSNRRASALQRSAFTGEVPVAARAGTARDGTPGLDTCTDPQRRLRVLLALGLFNDYEKDHADNSWCCPAVCSYNVTFSPRLDSLVIITDCPRNVAGRMVARGEELRVPGLRYNPDKECSQHTLHILDIVSGAEMIITDRVTGRVKPGAVKNERSRIATARELGMLALTEAEMQALAQIPEMTPAIEILLAALAVRLDARDPQGGWAMGYWFWDPLDRPGAPQTSSPYGFRRVLRGCGNRWELRWSEFPYVQDVATMLTHPIIGVPGCQARDVSNGYDIALGNSVLALRSWYPAGDRGSNLRPQITNVRSALLS
ncbi:hypothetical protein KGQ19_22420 [Catenulispora sp. NL8]|uniref:Uncharacterized protein n=1 Tax=Catenulispora pinistramenti TaxID=2705254 RepID=A0ABS5KU91_9ACTN|nr:hypothetical protein [Catenulispora pinistramenti]MBS2549623.1 hypothetical protein [Catenulispora pinistramenti]